MVMFLSRGWQPQWGFEGQPHDIVIVTTEPGPQPSAKDKHSEVIRQRVADFLDRQLANATTSEDEATASFLYVVLSRPPTRDEVELEVRSTGPLVEFGFGEAPASPEEWECVPLSNLLQAATQWLRAT